MNDPRAAEGVEHLQTAARELLKAARSFLAVVEEVVEDPERLTGAAAGLADLFRSGSSRREEPWERAAWDDDHTDLWGEDEPPDEPDPAADTPASDAATPRTPATGKAQKSAATSRVRRISVD